MAMKKALPTNIIGNAKVVKSAWRQRNVDHRGALPGDTLAKWNLKQRRLKLTERSQKYWSPLVTVGQILAPFSCPKVSFTDGRAVD